MSPSQWQSTKLETPPQFLGRKKPSLSRWFGEDIYFESGFFDTKSKASPFASICKKSSSTTWPRGKNHRLLQSTFGTLTKRWREAFKRGDWQLQKLPDFLRKKLGKLVATLKTMLLNVSILFHASLWLHKSIIYVTPNPFALTSLCICLFLSFLDVKNCI